jgi:fructose-1,6-bisphosphatase
MRDARNAVGIAAIKHEQKGHQKENAHQKIDDTVAFSARVADFRHIRFVKFCAAKVHSSTKKEYFPADFVFICKEFFHNYFRQKNFT